MASSKSCYLLKEEKVKVCMARAYLQVDDNGTGKEIWSWFGGTTGSAKVTTGSTSSMDFRFRLTLTEREPGKMSVELMHVYRAPLKTFVAEDADIQIILEIQGRHFSTDWLPLEKNLDVLRRDISHDVSLLWEHPYLGYKEIIVSVLAGHKPELQVETPFKINKKILEEAIGSNFVIVSSSGTEIKCHKSFLCAHSDVLRAMIEGSLTEAVANRVDMSDEAVKAFLAFLYYMDITEASKDCEIALELLHAAHKYNITSLETAMRDVFLKKEVSWLSVDGAVRLFAFCHNLENGEELKMRGVEALKANAHGLKKSECLKELFKTYPEAAMELFKCCLTT